jgi:hypothetical protein
MLQEFITENLTLSHVQKREILSFSQKNVKYLWNENTAFPHVIFNNVLMLLKDSFQEKQIYGMTNKQIEYSTP